MKGTLHKTESGWQVWYHAKEDLFYGNTGVRILLLHSDEPLLVDKRWEGQEVEFEIVDYSQKCKECGDEIENISNNDKIDLCNKCIYSKCRCIFC